MKTELFRKEALSKYQRTEAPGGVIQIAPPWTSAMFVTMALLFVALLLLAGLTRAQVAAEGRGVVHPDQPAVLVRAPFSGAVLSIARSVRENGAAGELLMTMDARTETAAHARCTADLVTERAELVGLEGRLARWNETSGHERDPSAALVALSQIRTQREKTTNLSQKCDALGLVVERSRVVFPVAGNVADVAVSVGSQVREGDVLATLVPSSASLVGYVALPEQYRSELAVGQAVRVKFDALPYDEVGAGSAHVTRVLDALPSGVKLEATEHAGVFAEVSIDAMPAGSGPPRAGMTFVADILTRRRRVLSLLFSARGEGG